MTFLRIGTVLIACKAWTWVGLLTHMDTVFCLMETEKSKSDTQREQDDVGRCCGCSSEFGKGERRHTCDFCGGRAHPRGEAIWYAEGGGSWMCDRCWEEGAGEVRSVPEYVSGGDARSGEDLEADKAIMTSVAARANDFLARLEAAEQRDDAAASRTTPPKRPARVSGMINSAVSALVSHVSPAHVRPPSRASHNADVGQLAH